MPGQRLLPQLLAFYDRYIVLPKTFRLTQSAEKGTGATWNDYAQLIARGDLKN
jgi:hypothetical protein